MKKDNSILAVRNKTVVKANELIQKSRFSLSLQQQKVVLYLISQIKSYEEDFTECQFSIQDFCRVCGIDYTSGKNYSALKTAIKEIADKSIWIRLEDGRETLLRWIEKPYINHKDGTVRIRLDRDMKPFLLQLQKNFTQYELVWTLHFKSKYTIRLYELVKSIHYYDLESYTRRFTLDELKQLLDGEKYKAYQDFKRYVLEPAIEEINKHSDKLVSYEPIKNGRAVSGIALTIESKDSIEALKIRTEIEKEYNLNQLSLFDEL